MSEFKVGDRVRVYGQTYGGVFVTNGETASLIEDMEGGGVWAIQFDDGDKDKVHIKQCRKLKKRERRRIWVRAWMLEPDKNPNGYYLAGVRPADADDRTRWVQFVEER